MKRLVLMVGYAIVGFALATPAWGEEAAPSTQGFSVVLLLGEGTAGSEPAGLPLSGP